MIRANSFRITAPSSSGLARTFIRQATSISVISSKPASLTPSTNPRGGTSSRTVPSLKGSGSEYLMNIYLTVLFLACSKSAILMKHCSAMSSIFSSSALSSSLRPRKRLFVESSADPEKLALSPLFRLLFNELAFLVLSALDM